MFKKILAQLNVRNQCKRYRLPLWGCPQFLFLMMGVIIIITAIVTYVIGIRLVVDPLIITLIVLLLSTILFIISFTITQSFEKMADVARMKTEFISIVSHQLRSPLSNLRWTIELLMSGRLGRIGEKQTEYFRILKENNARMEELIQDLLIVSRIDAGNFPLHKKEISLTKLTQKLISEFEIFAKSSNIDLKFQAQEDLPKVLADPSQIKLVIDNLLDNAIRYTTRKGIVIIKLKKRGKKLYFEIKDNGVGIPKEDQKYIFQKFFRSTNAMKYQTQGSGLGLHIAKSIIERSGGKIDFKSQEGVGSTFWFTLSIKS